MAKSSVFEGVLPWGCEKYGERREGREGEGSEGEKKREANFGQDGWNWEEGGWEESPKYEVIVGAAANALSREKREAGEMISALILPKF